MKEIPITVTFPAASMDIASSNAPIAQITPVASAESSLSLAIVRLRPAAPGV